MRRESKEEREKNAVNLGDSLLVVVMLTGKLLKSTSTFLLPPVMPPLKHSHFLHSESHIPTTST